MTNAFIRCIYTYMRIPKYQKIVNELKQKILAGEYKPGDKLPGFVALAREFNVSNITSNRALTELENLGLVQRMEREGTFVADRNTNFDKILVVSSIPIVDDHPQIMGYWQGIIEAGNKNNVSIELTYPDSADFRNGSLIEQTNPKGLIFLMKVNAEAIRIARAANKPYVILGIEDEENICILEDRFNACAQLAQMMTADGYCKIGFIGNLSASNHRLARDGYIEGTKSLNIGHRFIRDANESNIREITSEIIEDGINSVIIMGGYLPIIALSVILNAERKIALGVLAENSTILRLKDNAYIAYYSQSETAGLAFDILKKLFEGNCLTPANGQKIFHPPFEIYRPERPERDKS